MTRSVRGGRHSTPRRGGGCWRASRSGCSARTTTWFVPSDDVSGGRRVSGPARAIVSVAHRANGGLGLGERMLHDEVSEGVVGEERHAVAMVSEPREDLVLEEEVLPVIQV